MGFKSKTMPNTLGPSLAIEASGHSSIFLIILVNLNLILVKTMRMHYVLPHLWEWIWPVTHSLLLNPLAWMFLNYHSILGKQGTVVFTRFKEKIQSTQVVGASFY